MAKQWTSGEIKSFLEETNPNVRKLFKALTKKGKANLKTLNVPVASVAIAMRMFKIKKKNPLYISERPADGGPPMYQIDPLYKRVITNFFKTFKEPRGPKKKVTVKKTRRKKGTRRKKTAVPTVTAKKRGRKRGRKKGSTVPKMTKGVFTIPVTSPADYEFWRKFAETINTSKGKTVVISTDGKSMTLKLE